MRADIDVVLFTCIDVGKLRIHMIHNPFNGIGLARRCVGAVGELLDLLR